MLGPYAAFIVASYAITAAVVLVLIGWVVNDYRHQKATLREFESKGLTRRSGTVSTDQTELDARDAATVRHQDRMRP